MRRVGVACQIVQSYLSKNKHCLGLYCPKSPHSSHLHTRAAMWIRRSIVQLQLGRILPNSGMYFTTMKPLESFMPNTKDSPKVKRYCQGRRERRMPPTQNIISSIPTYKALIQSDIPKCEFMDMNSPSVLPRAQGMLSILYGFFQIFTGCHGTKRIYSYPPFQEHKICCFNQAN